MSTTLMRRPPRTICRRAPAGAACCDPSDAAVNPRLRRKAPAVAPAAFLRKSLRFGMVLSSLNRSSVLVSARRVAQLLPNHLGRIGVRLRPELLHAPVEHFGNEQVAVLVGRQLVRTAEHAGLPAAAAPAVQVIP